MRRPVFSKIRRLLVAAPIAAILLAPQTVAAPAAPAAHAETNSTCSSDHVCLYPGASYWNNGTPTWHYNGAPNVNVDLRSMVAGAVNVVYVRNEYTRRAMAILISYPNSTGEIRLYCFRPLSTAQFPTPSNGGVQVNTLYLLSGSTCPP